MHNGKDKPKTLVELCRSLPSSIHNSGSSAAVKLILGTLEPIDPKKFRIYPTEEEYLSKL